MPTYTQDRNTSYPHRLYEKSIFVHDTWNTVFDNMVVNEYSDIKRQLIEIFGSYRDPATQLYYIRQGVNDTPVYLHGLFQNVFEPFRHCHFDELRCIILIDTPYHRKLSLSGMPLIEQEGAIKRLSIEGLAFEKLIRNYYNIQDYTTKLNPLSLLGQGCLILYSRPLSTSEEVYDLRILDLLDSLKALTIYIVKNICSKRTPYINTPLPILKLGNFNDTISNMAKEFTVPFTLTEGYNNPDIMSEIITASPLETVNNYLSTYQISLIEW